MRHPGVVPLGSANAIRNLLAVGGCREDAWGAALDSKLSEPGAVAIAFTRSPHYKRDSGRGQQRGPDFGRCR